MFFKDRIEAGQKLAQALEKYKGEDVVVYALPRGGVVLGREVAKKLGAPLSLIVVRKIGHPLQKEYAVCAVAEDGDSICSESEKSGVNENWLNKEIENEQQEIKRRKEIYLAGAESLSVLNKIAIIVDDGIATGLTMELAIKELQHEKPKKIIVAVPVAPSDVAAKIQKEVDELILLDNSIFYLGAVGSHYENFSQVEDAEVVKILKEFR